MENYKLSESENFSINIILGQLNAIVKDSITPLRDKYVAIITEIEFKAGISKGSIGVTHDIVNGEVIPIKQEDPLEIE